MTSEILSKLGLGGGESSTSKDVLKLVGIGGAVVAGVIVVRRVVRGRKRVLNVPNYEKDKIYLCSFPRPAAGLINLSPFSLKVEMWLRMNNLNYEYIVAKHPSTLGQYPYVELNGEEIAESNLILKELSAKLTPKAEDWLSLEQKGSAQAFKMMSEHSLAMCYAMHRYSLHLTEFWEVLKVMFPTYRTYLTYLPIMKYSFRRGMNKHARSHGYGRLSHQQVHQIGCDNIQAISNYLGGKKYFMGDAMSVIDTFLFSHLTQILYNPMPTNPLRDYIETEAVNVKDYVERVRAEVFPDWEGLLKAAGDGKYLTRA